MQTPPLEAQLDIIRTAAAQVLGTSAPTAHQIAELITLRTAPDPDNDVILLPCEAGLSPFPPAVGQLVYDLILGRWKAMSPDQRPPIQQIAFERKQVRVTMAGKVTVAQHKAISEAVTECNAAIRAHLG